MLEKLRNNDASLTDVCLNNVGGISEKLMCEIFETFRNNDRITRFSATNCDVSITVSTVFFVDLVGIFVTPHWEWTLLLRRVPQGARLCQTQGQVG